MLYTLKPTPFSCLPKSSEGTLSSEAFSENIEGGQGERGEKNSSEFVTGFMLRQDAAEVDCGVNVELVQ